MPKVIFNDVFMNIYGFLGEKFFLTNKRNNKIKIIDNNTIPVLPQGKIFEKKNTQLFK